MEINKNRNRNSMELVFELDNDNKIKKQRKIFEYYLKSETQKQRKLNKCDVLSIQTIEGLLHVLNLSTDGLIFIDKDDLISNITTLLQNMEVHILMNEETIDTRQDSVFVLYKGQLIKNKETISKQSYNLMNMLLENRQNRSSEKFRAQKNSFNFSMKKSFMKRMDSAQKMTKINTNIRKDSIFRQIQKNNSNKKSRSSSIHEFEISVSESQSPVLIDLEIKGPGLIAKVFTFQARSDHTVIFSFSRTAIERFSIYFMQVVKQKISNFIKQNLGIQSLRLIHSLLPKIQKNIYPNKSRLALDNKKIMLLYKGEALLENNYQVQIRQNSVLWPKEKEKYLITVTQDNTLCIFIQLISFFDLFHQFYPQILNDLRKRVNATIQKRQSFFFKNTQKLTQQLNDGQKPFYSHHVCSKVKHQRPLTHQSKRPQASKTEHEFMRKIKQESNKITRLEGDQLSIVNFGHDYTQRRKNILSNPQVKKFKNNENENQQDRFRIMKNKQKNKKQFFNQMFYDKENKPFMSLYPFYKIMQSTNKVAGMKKEYQNIKKFQKNKQNIHKKQILKQREIKEKKKIFYNQKVRKMKIRNIASKQIPNGHKKKFNADSAEKQIAQNSLISPIIQYPMEGFNQEESISISASKRNLKQLKDRKEKTPVFRKTDNTSIHRNQQSLIEKQFISIPITVMEIQERITSTSNFKRTTIDVSDYSFHNKQFECYIEKAQKSKKNKKTIKRPITSKKRNFHEEDFSNMKEFFIKCQRIKTET